MSFGSMATMRSSRSTYLYPVLRLIPNSAQVAHPLPTAQPGHELHSFFHSTALFPGHAPPPCVPLRLSPMCPVCSVTYVRGPYRCVLVHGLDHAHGSVPAPERGHV